MKLTKADFTANDHQHHVATMTFANGETFDLEVYGLAIQDALVQKLETCLHWINANRKTVDDIAQDLLSRIQDIRNEYYF